MNIYLAFDGLISIPRMKKNMYVCVHTQRHCDIYRMPWWLLYIQYALFIWQETNVDAWSGDIRCEVQDLLIASEM